MTKFIKTLKNELKQDKKNWLYKSKIVEIITPEVEILDQNIDWEKILRNLERAIRTSYQSFDKVDKESHYKIIKLILSNKHESTLEHEKITFKVITNRWVTHELVRHRLASYTQESTRYVNPFKKWWFKVIYPSWIFEKDSTIKEKWFSTIEKIAVSYKEMSEIIKPQEARWVLPNDLKTEIIVTMNLREIRHFINLRANEASHPDIRVIAVSLLQILHKMIPLIFDDLYEIFLKNLQD
jgi:thymidylate synthase (FAD)